METKVDVGQYILKEYRASGLSDQEAIEDNLNDLKDKLYRVIENMNREIQVLKQKVTR